jgi:D-aspartate ligase
VIPVVVMGGSLNALGVVRSLARGGMPIFVVEKARCCPAAWSRFSQFASIPGTSARALVDGLIDLSVRIGGRPVLILTTDTDVNTVSKFRDELAPFFRFTMPSREMVQMLSDKSQFQVLAERENLPVPRGLVLSGRSDIPLIKKLTPPLVVKAADKAPLILNNQDFRPVRVETLEQASSVVAQLMERTNRLAIQEWIEGGDSDIYFSLFVCDSNCNVTAAFSGRKLVCTPPVVGITAVCLPAPEMDGELTRLTRDFIALVGYKGIGSLECKRDRRNGRLFITEPTVGRTDWQEEIATLCGTNIPLLAYQAETGATFDKALGGPEAAVWRSSIRFRIPRGAMPARMSVWDGYFRLKDPVPGLYYYAMELFPLGMNKLLRYILPKGWTPARA